MIYVGIGCWFAGWVMGIFGLGLWQTLRKMND